MNNEEMSLLSHLGELRKRLFITMGIFLFFLIIGFTYTKGIYDFVTKDLPGKLVVLGPSEILWIYLMIAAIFALIGTIPFAAYQIWAFVRPAMHPSEQKMSLLYIPALFILFVLGLCAGYFVVLPNILNFLTFIGADMFTNMFTAEKYFSFVLNLIVPFAAFFDLPIIVMFLTSIGLITPMLMQKSRKVAYFALVIIACMISPPDFVSHISVSIPLLFIYEAGIILSKIVYKRRMIRLQKLEN